MKKIISAALAAAMTAAFAFMPVNAGAAGTAVTYNYNLEGGLYDAQSDHTRQMESLNRGLAAVKTNDGVYLSWRLYDSEDAIYGSAESNVTFNVYRDDTRITDEPIDVTNYTDTTAGTKYQVAPVVDGVEGDKCEAVTVNPNSYFDIDLTKPASETIVSPSGQTVGTFNFSPADCSTGDLDGDGEYEIVIKWVSSEHDVGSPGDGLDSLSGTVRFAAYKLNGKKLWQNDINLGKNVYSSAHTVQFLVYDFNGDGKAEMMCQTSLGSTDASGAYVSHAAKTDTKIQAYTDEDNANAEFRSDWGPLTKGDEFLTVFNGETGEAIDTINFPTARVSDGSSFGDTSGNRSNRFVASVAYLDGVKPYAVYLRGYYFGRNGRQRCGISGTSFDGEKLSVDYQFDTLKGQPGYYDGASIYVGQGNHNCTVADVDNDGKDEFITGALCMEVNDDNEFKPRWCTFKEHGDALHIGDYDPTHKGFEFFTVHEDGNGVNSLSGTDVTLDFGMSVIDADTGEMIKHWSSGDDNGRGIMANIGAGGFYQITSANAGTYRSDGGSNFTAGNYGMSMNFRIFWDGDLYDELLDGTDVTDWNGNGMGRIFRASGCSKINGTKSNPGLQADLFGDWREELVYPTADGNKLRVFMTTTPTDYKIKTLMQDPVYRSGVAAEQTAYNQPPHVGFYMGEDMFKPAPVRLEITKEPNKTVYAVGEDLNLDGMEVSAVDDNGNKEQISAYAVSGYSSDEAGEKQITITYKGVSTVLTVYVKNIARIEITSEPEKKEVPQMSSLDTKGLVVTAVYDDETKAIVDDYTLEYSTKVLGEQTVTVSYMGKTAEFKITVVESSLADLNNTYTNDSATSTTTLVEIGSYSGSFTLEHKVTINSMPADGSGDKRNTDGFFFRFMGDGSVSGLKDAVGGGWQLVNDNGNAKVQWKSTDVQDITKTSLTIGETYTFTYDFSHVGDGEGAKATLTITDSNGKVMGYAENLNLRNLSNDAQKVDPITTVEIHNQARNANTPASVTISDAKILGETGIDSVSGTNVTVTFKTLNGLRAYAAEYENNALVSIKDITPSQTGTQTVDCGFEPDKVFIWSNIQPVDLWVKPQQ